MTNKKKINEHARDAILSSMLNKGSDLDQALDWIEKTFDVVSNDELIQTNIEEAKKRGFLTTL